MFTSLNQSVDHRRVDTHEQRGHHRILRAVERAKAQFSQKTKASSSRNGSDGLTGSYFDYLPPELVVDILSCTDWRDLLRCRLVSKAFKDLVDTQEHVIITRILSYGTYLGLLAQLFHPPKLAHGAERRPTIHYVSLLEMRHITCSQLAYYLCDKALGPMFERPGASSSVPRFDIRKERRELEARKEQAVRTVQRKLTKQLYYVLHFLTHTRLRMEAAQAILAAENSDENSLSPSELSRTYNDIQSSIISSFDNATLISTHHAMHFLVNSMRLYMSPEPPHNQNDEMIALMLRCATSLRRCVEFFAADSPSAPRTLRKQFMLDMQSERDEAEAKSGKAKDGLRRNSSVYGRVMRERERERAERKVWTPKIGEVWFEAAKRALIQRGLKEHRPDGVYFFPDCSGDLMVGCPDCKTR